MSKHCERVCECDNNTVAVAMRSTIADMTGPPMKVPFFSYAPEVEEKKKKKLAKAAKRILKHYSVSGK